MRHLATINTTLRKTDREQGSTLLNPDIRTGLSLFLNRAPKAFIDWQRRVFPRRWGEAKSQASLDAYNLANEPLIVYGLKGDKIKETVVLEQAPKLKA